MTSLHDIGLTRTLLLRIVVSNATAFHCNYCQWRIQKILVGGIWSQNLKNSDVFTKIESDFSAENGNSNVFFAQNQVVSKKKKVFTKIESDFSAGFVTFRSVGGDASRNGAELFKIEADFSAKIVTFRLVGGECIPPTPPPLNPPLIIVVWLLRINHKLKAVNHPANSSGLQ